MFLISSRNILVEAGTIRMWSCVMQCKDAAASLCPFGAEACTRPISLSGILISMVTAGR